MYPAALKHALQKAPWRSFTFGAPFTHATWELLSTNTAPLCCQVSRGDSSTPSPDVALD